VAAAAADQAGIIFDQMAALIESSDLPLDAKRGIRAVYHKGEGPNRKPLGRIRVISADVKKNSGAIPTLVLVDELQAHPDGYLYQMFRGRLKKRNAQMVTISNAGWGKDSFLGEIRDAAHEHESFTRRGMMNRAQMGGLEFFEWCLSTEDNPRDVRVVKKANPLKHVTPEVLSEWLNSPSTQTTTGWAEWLRGACGIWTAALNPWLSAPEWDALRVDIGQIEEGEEVYAAVRDGAVVIAAKRGEAVQVKAFIGEPDLTDTEKLLISLAEKYRLAEVAVDGKAFGILFDQLTDRGLPMVEFPHRAERLTQVSASIQALVSKGGLHHDGDPELRAHVLAGTTKQDERGWRLMMLPENRALIAMAIAVHQASLMETPVYWVV
jgi:phage terminase large subunit-like protein